MRNLIEVRHLTTAYEDNIIHDDISFDVRKNEVFGILGGSGSGKSTLLNNLIMLQTPKSGSIKIFGSDVGYLSLLERNAIAKRCGVLFQFGALFSNLTVLENVGLMLEEYSSYPKSVIVEISKMWLERVGLSKKAYNLHPYELSGGMKKRVGLARAMVLDPEILFLDEPTSGLDPLSAGKFDDLILEIKESNGFSVVLITHDLDTIHDIVDRFILLKGAKIIEKHITINRNLPGADHSFSLEYSDLKQLVHDVRYAEQHPDKIAYDAIIGGRTNKVVLDEEKHLRSFVHRGIFAFRDIKAGDRLNADNIVVLRPGNCENGIEPKFYNMLIDNKVRVNKDIESNQPIKWEDVLNI